MWFKKLVSKKVQMTFISYGYLLIKNCQNKENYKTFMNFIPLVSKSLFLLWIL